MPDANDQHLQNLIVRPSTMLVLASEQDEARESANLIILRKARKDYEAQFKELKRPFEEGIHALNVKFAQKLDPIKAAEAATNQAILTWKAKERQRIDAENRERARVQAEQDRLQRQREEEARRPNMPPPPKLAPILPAVEPARGWETQHGTLTTRKVPKFEILDESQVPLEMDIDGVLTRFWNIDQIAVGKVRRAYGEKASPIPGIRFYYDEGLSVK